MVFSIRQSERQYTENGVRADQAFCRQFPIVFIETPQGSPVLGFGT
jgi:hypothetical protein